ncbi:MAG: uracil-DNA glycosylase family protein [Thermoleophilia bacterium]
MSASVDPPLTQAARRLASEAATLVFGPPVTHVYNPLEYAWRPHAAYLERYGSSPREIVLLGMNPGPWGMAQTGVPFGEVASVRAWLRIEDEVNRPAAEHPKRPVEGFACRRSEVSGRRLWGWAGATFGTPEAFFDRFFVANYCPLAFLEESGRNRTPDRLPAAEREPLFAACDRALRDTVGALGARMVVGIGRFAEQRAKAALHGTDVRVGRVTHPSPANPAANAGWEALVAAELEALGVTLPPL